MTATDPRTLHDLERLKYAYMRCLDQKRWDELETLFLPDATATYSGGGYSLSGREEVLGFLRRNMDRTGFHSSHRVHHPEIDVAEDGVTADATWALDDTTVDTDWNVIVIGSAFYEDRYRLVDTEDGRRWRIAHTGYRRMFEVVYPLGSIEGARVTASWWSTDGRSSLPVL